MQKFGMIGGADEVSGADWSVKRVQREVELQRADFP